MAKLAVLYKKTADAGAFDKYYLATHIPLAKKIPGLRHYEISEGSVDTPAGESPYHLVALLSFESKQALLAGLSSAEGQAAVGDLGNFATSGADVLIFDTKSV